MNLALLSIDMRSHDSRWLIYKPAIIPQTVKLSFNKELYGLFYNFKVNFFSIPKRFIFANKVLSFTFKILAAPLGPLTRQSV